MRPDGHQIRFGLLEKEKDLLTLLGIESRSFVCPARNHFTNGKGKFVPKTKADIWSYQMQACKSS
jgi:hypothetical protein